ncbi:twin-arginine translocase TatA/TatE family subunit [Altererythrobacter sp. KTW20L]|uniref:twin-arginine translocase TatA/TatE family subunit n=1 Tax=Altererythrobacter sp. KTW20L TaxID=2942210 RepID=UPI0020BF81D7|nr:twin-arginine translocase TatA/TatE family subunit [Altererythrobacter sp. KTW20L]MCL6250990.1 twin-arginine translocase TatA/TatE family subunit [Altererythrobacter sp. KTW20L]
MSLGPWQLAIIAILILVLFGRGRISEMMGDFGKGINSFKKGMSETGEDKPAAPQAPPAQIASPEAAPAPTETPANTTANTSGNK